MQLRGLHSALRPNAEAALTWAAHFGVPVTVTSVYRSVEDQRRLRLAWERCVAEGRWRPELPAPDRPEGCKFPANRPGDSAHNYRLAWDSVVPRRFQPWWNHVRRAMGFEVLEHDPIHAQLRGWRRIVF